MKKNFGQKIGTSFALVAFLALLPANAFAADSYTLTVGDEDLYVASGTKTNTAETATYNASQKTLTLKGYSEGAINTDIKNLKVVLSGVDSSINSTSSSAFKATNGVTFSGNKKLTMNKNLVVNNGDIVITGEASLILGTSSIKLTDGNLKIDNASISGKDINLVDTDDEAQEKITIGKKSTINLTGKLIAEYDYSTNTKGITIDSSVCTKPATTIINIKNSDTTKTVFSTDKTTAISDKLNISAANCAGEKTDAENPDTIDTVYVYLAILVASSAILAYRRYLAKR